jgi:hypothetical protein
MCLRSSRIVVSKINLELCVNVQNLGYRIAKMTPSPANHYYAKGQAEDDEVTVKNDKNSESPVQFDCSPRKTKNRCKKTQKSFRKFSIVHQSTTDLNVITLLVII